MPIGYYAAEYRIPNPGELVMGNAMPFYFTKECPRCAWWILRKSEPRKIKVELTKEEWHEVLLKIPGCREYWTLKEQVEAQK